MSAIVWYEGNYVDVYTVDDACIDFMYRELWLEETTESLEAIKARTKREFVCKFMEAYQAQYRLSFCFWETP